MKRPNLANRLISFLGGINYRRQLFITFVFGVVTASVFTPLVVPPIQDFQVDHGLIPTPRPDISLQYRNTSSTGFLDNEVDVDLTEQRYRTYFLKVRNPTHKLITDLSVATFHSGCPVNVGVFTTSIDAAIITRDADEITTGRFFNNGCAATAHIEEIPPQKSAMIYIVIDTTQRNTNLDNDDQLDHREVALFINYQWEHNGRLYFVSIRDLVFVDDRLTAGDIFN